MPSATAPTPIDASQISSFQKQLVNLAWSLWVALDAIAQSDWDNIKENDIDPRMYWARFASPNEARDAAMRKIAELVIQKEPSEGDWIEFHRLTMELDDHCLSGQTIIDANKGLFTDLDDGGLEWDVQIETNCRRAAGFWKAIRGTSKSALPWLLLIASHLRARLDSSPSRFRRRRRDDAYDGRLEIDWR